MDNNKIMYFKTDDNMFINEKYIRWVKQTNNCLELCTIMSGCHSKNTHKICKINSPENYNKLYEHLLFHS
jgi:hypothetical protein